MHIPIVEGTTPTFSGAPTRVSRTEVVVVLVLGGLKWLKVMTCHAVSIISSIILLFMAEILHPGYLMYETLAYEALSVYDLIHQQLYQVIVIENICQLFWLLFRSVQWSLSDQWSTRPPFFCRLWQVHVAVVPRASDHAARGFVQSSVSFTSWFQMFIKRRCESWWVWGPCILCMYILDILFCRYIWVNQKTLPF